MFFAQVWALKRTFKQRPSWNADKTREATVTGFKLQVESGYYCFICKRLDLQKAVSSKS